MSEETEGRSYDRRSQAKIDALKPLLTPEFLATLVEAAKVTGWDNDYAEVWNFVEGLHEIAEMPVPNLEAYDYDKD